MGGVDVGQTGAIAQHDADAQETDTGAAPSSTRCWPASTCRTPSPSSCHQYAQVLATAGSRTHLRQAGSSPFVFGLIEYGARGRRARRRAVVRDREDPPRHRGTAGRRALIAGFAVLRSASEP